MHTTLRAFLNPLPEDMKLLFCTENYNELFVINVNLRIAQNGKIIHLKQDDIYCN